MKDPQYNEDENVNPGGEISVQSGFAAWLDNFWYHYKWWVICIGFALISVLFLTIPQCGQEKEDTLILYAGPTALTSTEEANVRLTFGRAVPDLDGNGKTTVALQIFPVYTADQMDETVDPSRNAKNTESYHQYLLTGETSVLLVDPSLFDELKKADRLADLTAYGADADDEFLGAVGIRLGDTALYETYAALRVLPEDTVVCLLRKYVTVKEKDYDVSRKTVEALLTFSD